MKTQPVFAGIDVGASRTKVAIINSDKELLGYAIKKSGIDFSATAEACLASSLQMAGSLEKDIANSVSTGYGRKNVTSAQETKTEIGCHAKGCIIISDSYDYYRYWWTGQQNY